jgi:hypothetical protein
VDENQTLAQGGHQGRGRDGAGGTGRIGGGGVEAEAEAEAEAGKHTTYMDTQSGAGAGI